MRGERNLIERFADACASMPDRTAFVFADRAYSYREFGGMVQAIRERLARHATPDERCVAVHATQDVWTYASILAVLADGRAYVPLNPHAPAERNRSCILQSGVRTLLCTSASTLVRAESEGVEGLRVDETGTTKPHDALGSCARIDGDAIAYLLFTSGSTGVPKGVPVHHRNVSAFLEAFVDRGGHSFTADDRFLQMFDLTFDLSVMSYGVPLSIGAACHVVPEGGPGFLGVAKTLTRGRVTVALMVPSVLSFLERYFDEIDLPDLRLSLFCGEALPVRIARAWWTSCAPHARLVNVYGPTEATIFCSAFELTRTAREHEAYRGIVSIGEPMPRTSFRVVRDDLSAVESGDKGELVIIGDQVTDRYWENPEKTAAAFITLPDGTRGYRSGDVVFEQHGRFHYVGRTDHQLKVDGYRVEAGEIEHAARAFGGVRDAALVGKVDEGGRTTLHLFLLPADGAAETLGKECRAFLAQKLPSYMVPHRTHALPTFPLNANGKVDRKALLARLGA